MAMKRYSILAAFLLVSADTPKQSPEKADVEALQGFWVLKTTEYLGEKADQDPTEDELAKLVEYRRRLPEERELEMNFRNQRKTLEFKGNTFEYREWIRPFSGEEGRVWSDKGTYKLDVSRSPKVMERKITISELPGHETTTYYCIYSVKGDVLQFCLNLSSDPKKLPTTFVTDKDEDVVLLTFRREKK
jgi:uncharacterized protein (TIGR03067 family)